MGNQRNNITAVSLLADFTIVLMVTIAIFKLSDNVGTDYILAFPCMMVFIQYVFGIYRQGLVEFGVIANAASIVISGVVSVLLVYVFMSGTDIERLKYLSLWLPAICISLTLWRYYLGRNSLFVTKKQVIACNLSQEISEELTKYLRNADHRYVGYHFVQLPPSELKAKLLEMVRSDVATIVVYNVDLLADSELAETLLSLRIESGMEIVTEAEFYGAIAGKIWGSEQHKIYALETALREGRSDAISDGINNFRMIFNVLIGFLFLLLLLVPMFVVAILVKISSPGPVFFKQKRLGKNRKEFTLYKFRTMNLDAESQGPKWASISDGRVTSLGKILRELHLDELPQIINICKGDINFVGPRPIRKYFAEQLATQIPNYNLRFLVKPGLTGWAQTLGPYGANFLEQKEKFEFDLFYIANRNRIGDIMIIGLTVGKVIKSFRTMVHGLVTRRTVRKF